MLTEEEKKYANMRTAHIFATAFADARLANMEERFALHDKKDPMSCAIRSARKALEPHVDKNARNMLQKYIVQCESLGIEFTVKDGQCFIVGGPDDGVNMSMLTMYEYIIVKKRERGKS